MSHGGSYVDALLREGARGVVPRGKGEQTLEEFAKERIREWKRTRDEIRRKQKEIESLTKDLEKSVRHLKKVEDAIKGELIPIMEEIGSVVIEVDEVMAVLEERSLFGPLKRKKISPKWEELFWKAYSKLNAQTQRLLDEELEVWREVTGVAKDVRLKARESFDRKYLNEGLFADLRMKVKKAASWAWQKISSLWKSVDDLKEAVDKLTSED